MKIRTGFVSNSSSAAYVLPKKYYGSTFNVAKKMIPLRDWGEQDEELLLVLKKYEEKAGKDTPITFSSCNYETYILPTRNYYVVMTCNNHPFYGAFPMVEDDVPEEVEKKLSTFDDEEDSDISNIEDLEYRYYGFEYWSPKHDIFFTPLSYTEKDKIRESLPEKWKYGHCSKHYSDVVKISGTEKICCPGCLIEEGGDLTGIKGLGRTPKIWTSFDRFEIIDFD